MPEGSTTHKGGTMRLGARRTLLETVDCITAKLYQARARAPATRARVCVHVRQARRRSLCAARLVRAACRVGVAR